MHDAFLSLDEYLRPPSIEPAPPPEPEPERDAAACFVETSPPQEAPACETAFADARRFRAALADALDVRLDRLLAEIATSVLARELHLAPADLQAIVRRELALAGDAPLCLRAHPEECAALRDCDCPVVADATLRRGDVMLELRSGTIDATLGFRLERALAGCAA